MFIQEFNFSISHCPGKDNVIADTLSRFPPGRELKRFVPVSADLNLMVLSLTGDYDELKANFSRLREDQMRDPWIRDRITFLESWSKDVLVLTNRQLSIITWFIIHEGLLFKKGDLLNVGYKLCVPKDQVKELVIAHHDKFGHFGKTKSYNHLKEKFYWKKMQHEIRHIIATCDLCQKTKCSKISGGARLR